MKSLLSYSRRHFDPSKPRSEHEFWDSSANILARNLHAILESMGEVTYIDGDEYQDYTGEEYDLYIGISRNFRQITESNTIGTSIYFAVNMHPAERKNVLEGFIKSEGLTDLSVGWDVDYQTSMAEAIDASDYILCVGNMAVYNSHIAYGVPKNKIKMLNYGVGKSAIKPVAPAETPRFLYVGSEIGLRKGFDIVQAMFLDNSLKNKKFHFDIVGPPAGERYRLQIEDLQKKYGDQVTFHGWVDSGSPAYKKLLEKSDFIICPALEEGQAGAVLDAISRGVIPLISANTGIDYAPLGLLELKLNSLDNLAILHKALDMPSTERMLQKQKTLEFYREYHEDFALSFTEAIDACLAKELYPKISVTMPIFNKEKTIISLIKHFELAAQAYQNVELHIIFDGCVDQTEKVVRDYYQKDRGYPVTFEVTPNIYEVKTNNIGLKKSTGKYCVILQDDNYIYDPNIFFEIANFMDKNPTAAILGCLAGVNFYPRGTKLKGAGQISMVDNEVYWRQDAATDPTLKDSFFEVDACMRGPLVLRQSFLEKHGYLDEAYAPFYMDDMDIAFRARDKGYKVYAALFDVENKSLTVAKYDPERFKFWEATMKRNADIFYSRWKPTTTKNYLRSLRIPIIRQGSAKAPDYFPGPERGAKLRKAFKLLSKAKNVFSTAYSQKLAHRLYEKRLQWLKNQAVLLHKDAHVLVLGPKSDVLMGSLSHCNVTLAGKNKVEYASKTFDAVVCVGELSQVPDGARFAKKLQRIAKPGAKLLISGSIEAAVSLERSSYASYGRSWYEQVLTESGFSITSLQPDAGVSAHAVERLWRSQPGLVGNFAKKKLPKKWLAPLFQVFVYNIPTLVLSRFENKAIVEDQTSEYLCIATRDE